MDKGCKSPILRCTAASTCVVIWWIDIRKKIVKRQATRIILLPRETENALSLTLTKEREIRTLELKALDKYSSVSSCSISSYFKFYYSILSDRVRVLLLGFSGFAGTGSTNMYISMFFWICTFSVRVHIMVSSFPVVFVVALISLH